MSQPSYDVLKYGQGTIVIINFVACLITAYLWARYANKYAKLRCRWPNATVAAAIVGAVWPIPRYLGLWWNSEISCAWWYGLTWQLHSIAGDINLFQMAELYLLFEVTHRRLQQAILKSRQSTPARTRRDRS